MKNVICGWKGTALGVVVVFLSSVVPVQAATLQGRVVDYKGGPMEGAKVWVSQDREVQATATNTDGQFSFDSVVPGKIEVVALKDGHSIGGKQGQFFGDDFVTIALDKPKDLSLRVINGRYEAIEGARLKSLFINESFTVNVVDLVDHGFPSIRTNAEGVMVIPNMPRFGYTSVAVSHAEYAESMLPTFPIGTEVDLIMNPGVKLRGRITNEAGDGVARARVSVSKVSQGRQYKFGEVLSDQDGFYTINVPPPSEYYLAARHPKYATGDPLGRRVPVGSQDVIADLTLPAAHFISGRMLMEGSGQPVALAKIVYENEEGVIFVESLSDREGKFTLTVAAGSGQLVVTPPERLMTVAHPSIPVDIRNTSTISVGDIALRPLPAVSGLVLDNHQRPVPNAQVRTLNTEPSMITTTNEQGEYYIQIEKMLDQGIVQLYAEHPISFQRAHVQLELDAFNNAHLQLRSFRPKLHFMPELARNNLSLMRNEPAPEWSCSDWFNLPEGKESLSLQKVRGKVVVLTFWAGFDVAGRSRSQMEELKYLHSVFGDNPDIQFMAIHDASLKPYEIELVTREWGIPFPVGCDVEGFTSFKTYNVNQIPQTVIIDAAGVLRYYEVDGRLHTLIKAMLRR